MAKIDLPQSRQTPVPGAQRRMPKLELYKGEEAISTAVRSLLAEGTPKVYFLVGLEGQAELTAAVADSYSELLHALDTDGFDIDVWNLEAEGRMPEDATIVALMDPRGEAAPVMERMNRPLGNYFTDIISITIKGIIREQAVLQT